MKIDLRNLLAVFTIFAMVATTEVADAQMPRANSDDGFDFHIGRDITLVGIGLGTVVGLGIYFAGRGHHLTGCVAAGQSGLELATSGDGKVYDLVGEGSAVKVGDLVRVEGKKKGKDAAGRRTFLVKHVAQDFGVCEAKAAVK